MKRTKGAGKRPYVVAMVLGTALTAIGTPAEAQPANVTEQAVADLSRYCTACWRNARLHPDCWSDCTQEVLCRLLERLTPASWEKVLATEGEERQEFLRAIDTVKKRVQRGRQSASHSCEIADPRDYRAIALVEEREVLWKTARDCLSPRQQHIVRLSLEGWPVQAIAGRLELSSERVSDEKYKAIRKLRRQLHAQG